MHNSDWKFDKSRFFMATMRSPNELQFVQNFEIDLKKQKYETVQIPEEHTYDISSLGWKSGDLETSSSSKRFLVYMDQKALYFTILLQKEVIFKKSMFIDLGKPTKIYFELYSESKIFFVLFFLWQLTSVVI